MRKESCLSLESIKKLKETAFNPSIKHQYFRTLFVSREWWEEYLDGNTLERDHEKKLLGCNVYVVDVMKG